MFKILITDPLDPQGLAIFDGFADLDYAPGLSKTEIIERIASYDGLMVRSGTKVDADIIHASSAKLKAIGRAGVGVDNIDLKAATEKGIVVINSPDGNTNSAAEHTIAMMLGLVRQIAPAAASMQRGEWRRKDFLGQELRGKTLGIVGLGKIGSRVAEIAQGIGMKLLGYDPFLTAELALEMGIELIALDNLFTRSDFITLHIPKNPQTVGIIGEKSLALMKPGVRIINCARGGLVDEQALIKAIQEGKIAGAALDVFDEEPLNPNSELLKLEGKILLTPHLGASTEEAQLNVALDVAEQMKVVLRGEFSANAVNLPKVAASAFAELRKPIQLAKYLGAFLRRLTQGESLKSLQLEVEDELASKDRSVLCLAAAVGYLSQDFECVSLVNAKLLLEERGIKLAQIAALSRSDYAREITLRLRTDKREYTLSAAFMSGDQVMLTGLNGYRFLMTPARHLLLTAHEDQPGVIARIANYLGEAKINISGMTLGRKDAEQRALMLCSLDEIVPESVLGKIAALEPIDKVFYLGLEELP